MPALEDLITANEVVEGTDPRLSDARTPTAHNHAGADVTSGTVAIARIPTGTTGSTVPFGNDARFTDSRTPTAHSTSHKTGGSDSIALDTLAAPTDITTLNATTSRHGLAPKLSNVPTEYLSGTGVYSTPAGGGGGAGTILAATIDTSGDRTVTSATLADLPTSATSVTFLIPPSGNYLVRLSATAGAQGTANAYQTWGLRESTTIVAGAVGESIAVRQGAAASELFIGAVKEFYFTGGTPGASRTLKWAAASSTSGSGIKANANSPAIMVVVAMP